LSHGSSVADSLFELSTDVFGNDLSVKLGLSNFADVYLNDQGLVGSSHSSVQRVGQLINSLSTTTDDCTGSGSEDIDFESVGSSFDLNSADISETYSSLDVLSNVVIEVKCLGVSFLFVKPVAVVASNDADAQTNWMYFLSH
jgi:hypothetical protein